MSRKKKFKAPLPVAYSNEPVLTTVQLAEYYQTDVDNIRKNFQRHKERFEEGKHYFKVEGEEINKLRVTISHLQISVMTRTLYFWTERGAARHAKILDTDKSWEVFDLLEEFYFDHEKFNWNKARTDGKFVHKNFTDVMEKFYEYAKVQGTTRPQVAFQMKYTRICNKLASLPPVGGRDKATVQQLGICSWSETRIAEMIIACIEQALPYKAIEHQIELWANAVDDILNKAYVLPLS